VLHQRTLTDQRRALGPEHPDTFTTRYSIAQEMSARGEHTAAEGELRAVLAIRERMLGPEHPDTLATWFSVAQEMAARGDHAGAEDEFRAVLPHLEGRLGLDHPVTLTLWFSIAREMAERGDHAGAAKEFRGMLRYLSRWDQTTRTPRRRGRHGVAIASSAKTTIGVPRLVRLRWRSRTRYTVARETVNSSARSALEYSPVLWGCPALTDRADSSSGYLLECLFSG
jgi:hypothetical protein